MKELFGLLLIWLAVRSSGSGNSGDVTVIVEQPSGGDSKATSSDHRFDDVADRLTQLGSQALPSQLAPVQTPAITTQSGAASLVTAEPEKPTRSITDGVVTVTIPDWTQQGVFTYPADVDHKAVDVPASALQSTDAPVIDKQVESQLEKTTYQGDPDPALGVPEPTGDVTETPQGLPMNPLPDMSADIEQFGSSTYEQELQLTKLNLETIRESARSAMLARRNAESQLESSDQTLAWCESQPSGVCMRDGVSDMPRIEAIRQESIRLIDQWHNEEIRLGNEEMALMDHIAWLETQISAQALKPQPQPVQQQVASAASGTRVVTYVIGPEEWNGRDTDVYKIEARIPGSNYVPKDHIVLDVNGKLGFPSYISNGDKIRILIHGVEFAGDVPTFEVFFYGQSTTLQGHFNATVGQSQPDMTTKLAGSAAIRMGEWVGTWGGFKPDGDNKDYMIELGSAPDAAKVTYVTVDSPYGSWSSTQQSLYFAQLFVNGVAKFTNYSPDAKITVNRGDKIEVAVSGKSIPAGQPVSFTVRLSTDKGEWTYKA